MKTKGDCVITSDSNYYTKNYNKVKFVLWLILAVNIGVAVTKIVVGYLINSTSLNTDGIHSLSDGISNIVGIVGVTIAVIPKDKCHPYGHKKSEIVASMFIGAMLLILGLKTISNGFYRFLNPQEISISLESLIILLGTIVVNILIAIYERKKGEEYDSFILISDSIHTQSDIFISIGVLISLIGVKFGLPFGVDSIVSIVISIFILKASFDIFKESIGVLIDKATVDEEQIRLILENFIEVKDIHNIRSRGSKNDMYVDMHIMIDGNTTTRDAHKLCHDIEKQIKENVNENCQVIIHVEPYYKS